MNSLAIIRGLCVFVCFVLVLFLFHSVGMCCGLQIFGLLNANESAKSRNENHFAVNQFNADGVIY